MTAAAKQASAATEALTRAFIDLASRGQRPRCGDYETSYLWLSEDPAERQQAQRLCHGCPVLDPCAAIGVHQHFGVWGAVDHIRAPGKKLPA
jgi:hypothetical protein